ALHYENSLGERDFKAAMLVSLPRDRAVHHSTIGPHKDDLEFTLDGFSLKKYASQCQQKSYLLPLKLAQFEFLNERRHTKPLLLPDDVYEKADEERLTRLMETVSGDRFGQVFITDPRPERIEQLLNDKRIENKIFLVGEGTAAAMVRR